jgi:hypothetical protein
VRGELVVLTGNIAALQRGERFVSRDLNRQWTHERVAAVRAENIQDAEAHEQVELLAAIEAVMARARGEVFVVDMHTTSAAGYPFVLFGDTLRQREFAFELPIAHVLGLEEQIDGALAPYLTNRGCVTFSVEGGQHDDPSSIDNLEAVLWLSLESAGVIARNALTKIPEARALLAHRRGTLPHVVEVLRRHAITPDDLFVMQPGFANLHRAEASQLLARDRHGDVRAPADGMVILPLYQPQGSEGFFWGREISAITLMASKWLRLSGVERLVSWLPGITKESEDSEIFCVDSTAMGIYPHGVFRMFGFRKIRSTGGKWVVSRSDALVRTSEASASNRRP